jgi:hypothetical protein
MKTIAPALPLALLFAVSGCGGGGSGATTPVTPPAAPPVVVTDPPPVVSSGFDAAAFAALSAMPMDGIVNSKLLPQLDAIFTNLMANGLNTKIGGVSVFADSADKFLVGKIAIGMSYLVLHTPKADANYARYLAGYRSLMDLTVDLSNESWGIYYYASALNKLKQAGVLEQAVSPATLAKLQTKLDWRSFVNPSTYALIGLPTNYYGVAFSIARLRNLLGWENSAASEALLQKMISHYKTFSAFGFSDETDGGGRFDRYSVLLIGEICQRLIETDMVVADADMAMLKAWLRQSVDLIKLRMNPAGNGFDYGRSLGAYADTAFAEVLSAAAHLNVLDADEKAMAYAFATRITAKYVTFWYDADTKSLNMWEKGRRTDGYRGISRILGENLSLAHQLIYTNNLWKADGFASNAPMAASAFMQGLDKLQRSTLTKFAGFDGVAYDRGLVTYRDANRIFSLPLVNGAATYHDDNSYFAIPYSYNLISGVADTQWPQLQARFTTDNNQTLTAAAYFRNVTTKESGASLQVNYLLDALDRTGGSDLVKDTRLKATVQYTFEPGQITRIDTYTPTAASQAMNKIELEFGTYSSTVTQAGNKFSFASGDVSGFDVEGLDSCTVTEVSTNTSYYTPNGAMKSAIRCSTGNVTISQPQTIKWVLKYKSGSLASPVPN